MAPYEEEGTVIFVDVDGVLNIGVRDRPSQTKKVCPWLRCSFASTGEWERTISKDLEDSPLLYTDASRDFAQAHRGAQWGSRYDEDNIERLNSVTEHVLPSEEGAYADLAVTNGLLVSPALACNMADIFRAAGGDASVVLASNWRKLEHAQRVKKLEAEVSKHLICPFSFNSRTRVAEEHGAADRLRFIGDYMEGLCGPQGKFYGRPLRAIILDDLFITPLDGWYCGRTKINSVSAAEAYLLSRVPSSAQVSVKLVHTYGEWNTASGLRVQVGAGLSNHFRDEALAFLDGSLPGSSRSRTVSAASLTSGEPSLLQGLAACLPCGAAA